MEIIYAMIKYLIHFGFGLILFNLSSLFAQERDSVIFLGDTLQVKSADFAKLDKSNPHLLKPLHSDPSSYLVVKEGSFNLQDKKIQIVDPLKDGVTKVLVIGNSFSDDGVESYLHDMARSTGKPMVIGNLFRGGAPLDFHLKNALENVKIYSYRKTTIDGIKSNTNKTSILEALKDENWDYICFQQASVNSGDWSSVAESLPRLFDYVLANYPVSSVKYLYHQTWAYAQNATTANFNAYNRDQINMFNEIVSVSKRIGELIPLYKIIPTGTAIQNGRTSFLGDNFTREGYHLDLAFGRYTAAATWYETLFSDLDKVNYIPSHISVTQANLVKEAAKQAVRAPFVISSMRTFKTQNVNQVDFDCIKINFGSDFIIPGWLSLLFEREGSGRFGILDNHNTATSVNIKVLQNFESRKANGPKITSFNTGVPAEVSQYYFRATIDKDSAIKPFLRVENLNPNKEYDLVIISSVEEETLPFVCQIEGSKSLNSQINPSYNRNKEMKFNAIRSKQDGSIDISFKLPKEIAQTVGVINGLTISQLN